MKLIYNFLFLIVFTGVLLVIYMSWATCSRLINNTSLEYSHGNGGTPCQGCEIPFNLSISIPPPQVTRGAGGVEQSQGMLLEDEVAIFGEDVLRIAKMLKKKVVLDLKKHVQRGARLMAGPYGINWTQLVLPRVKPTREMILCRIKSLQFNPVDQRTSQVFFGKKFPSEPLFTEDFLGMGANVQDGAQYKSCAVVSSSGALFGSGHGLDIDSHDFIIRFNDAPTKGFEEDVGTRTSMRIINSLVFTQPEFQFPPSFNASAHQLNSSSIIMNLRKLQTEKLTALWSSTPKYLIWDACNYSASIEQWHSNPEHPLFEKYFELMKDENKYGRNKYYILNCRVLWKLWDLVHEFTLVRIHGTPPTSGFLGIILAMQKCERVDVYEYIPSSRESDQCHYYGPPSPSNCAYKSWHPVSAEKLFLLNLSDSSDKQIYIDGIISVPGVSKVKCGN